MSVVVPTRDRAHRLGALLESLDAQLGIDFEVIVVDNGSLDETPELLSRKFPRLGLRSVRLERGAGAGTARNAGWRLARAPLVAFVDDDCTAEPGWLQALVTAHRRQPAAVVQGRTDPEPDELHKLGAFSRTQHVMGLGPHFQTCNIAYPRELLERLGGFDEDLRYTGEDTDLAWRAREAGSEATFEDGARVRHAVHSLGAAALVRRSQGWADTVAVVKRHPELRRHYTMSVFWKPTHAWLPVALAGFALERRRRAFGLLAVPWVVHTLPRYGALRESEPEGGWSVPPPPGNGPNPRGRIRALLELPARLAVDVTEMAALARGSARYRTFFL